MLSICADSSVPAALKQSKNTAITCLKVKNNLFDNEYHIKWPLFLEEERVHSGTYSLRRSYKLQNPIVMSLSKHIYLLQCGCLLIMTCWFTDFTFRQFKLKRQMFLVVWSLCWTVPLDMNARIPADSLFIQTLTQTVLCHFFFLHFDFYFFFAFFLLLILSLFHVGMHSCLFVFPLSVHCTSVVLLSQLPFCLFIAISLQL